MQPPSEILVNMPSRLLENEGNTLLKTLLKKLLCQGYVRTLLFVSKARFTPGPCSCWSCQSGLE